MVIVIILLMIALIGLGLGCWYYYNKDKESISSADQIRQSKDNEVSQWKEKVHNLEGQNITMKENLTATQCELDNLKKTFASADTSIAEKQSLIKDLEAQREVLNSNLAKLATDYDERQKLLAEKLNLTQEERIKLTEEIASMKENSAAINAEKDQLEKEIENLQKVLYELKERSRLAIIASKKEENSLGIYFMINDKEKSLIAALDAICESYPDLVRDMRKIEWEKVWRPKIQTYRSELSGKQGIYKITLKDDEEVCYIGQARDIYTRWFEHMKKMVGMDSKGNEKLYEYSVGDFYWKVIEEVEDSSKLDEAEHYWIGYYACTEVGLNKKV